MAGGYHKLAICVPMNLMLQARVHDTMGMNLMLLARVHDTVGIKNSQVNYVIMYRVQKRKGDLYLNHCCIIVNR